MVKRNLYEDWFSGDETDLTLYKQYKKYLKIAWKRRKKKYLSKYLTRSRRVVSLDDNPDILISSDLTEYIGSSLMEQIYDPKLLNALT